MDRIGIFGGTFDPPHLGHLIAAQLAVETFELSQMLFIPAADPPLKTSAVQATPPQRLEMIQLATESNPRFAVSDIELHRAGPSYSIDTITTLRAKHSQAEFFLFIGMDNLVNFKKWKDHEHILETATLVAMLRPTMSPKDIPDEMRSLAKIFPIPLIDISSTVIRERIKAGKTVRYLIPEAVESYIRSHKLYQ